MVAIDGWEDVEGRRISRDAVQSDTKVAVVFVTSTGLRR